MIKNFTIPADFTVKRLDDALSGLAVISKGEARRIIDRGGCAVNQAMVRVASRSVKHGDILTVGFIEAGRFKELILPSEAIIYQNKELIAINKPSGTASQRTPYQLKGTVEYWIQEEFSRQGIKEPVRIVHRLDKGTSGVMLFPKNRQTAAMLSEQFSSCLIKKRYLALVSGIPAQDEWYADGPIGKIGTARWGIIPEGRSARTGFRLLATNSGACGRLSLIEACPMTGRTHQIRVHLAAAGLPIAGDVTYGGITADRLMLHCEEIRFIGRDNKPVVISALPGDDFVQE